MDRVYSFWSHAAQGNSPGKSGMAAQGDDVSYCSASDLYAFGVTRGAAPNPGRVLASALSSTCTLDVHGFDTGTPILFRPAGSGGMPAGLSEGVTYYAESLTEHTFRVRATSGGSAISFTDAVDPLLVITPLPIAEAIAWAKEMLNDMTPAQAVPYDDTALYPDGVPAIVRMTAAELAAGKLLAGCGAASKSLSEVVDAAAKRLARWSGGVPLRGTPDASRTNVPAAGPAATSTATDPRGWKQFGGL